VSQSKHLWDVLRDLLSLEASDGADERDTDEMPRAKLTACNEGLVEVAGQLHALHARADELRLDQTAALTTALADEQAGKQAAASRSRDLLPAVHSALGSVRTSLKLAQTRHAALVL
jgi:hypothetical protein